MTQVGASPRIGALYRDASTVHAQQLQLLVLLATAGMGHGGYTGWEVQNDPVVELDTGTFGEAVSGSIALWLVDFYAPWCGHCKQLAPEWTDAAKRLAKEIPDEVKLAAVDCTVNSALCTTYEVSSYPTIVAVEHGEATQLPDFRRAAEILTYVRQKRGFPWERAAEKDDAGGNAGGSAVSTSTLVTPSAQTEEDYGIEKTFRGLPDSIFFKGAFCHNDGAAKLHAKHAVTAVIDTAERCIEFCIHRDGAGAAVYHGPGRFLPVRPPQGQSASSLATRAVADLLGAGARADATVNKRQCSCRRAKPCGADRRKFGIAHESHRSHTMGQTGGATITLPDPEHVFCSWKSTNDKLALPPYPA